MDVPAVITFIYKVAEEILSRIEQAKECPREAERIALRTQNLIGTLHAAARTFHNDAALMAKLVELRTFLDSVPPLLEQCVEQPGALQAFKRVVGVRTLAKALAKKETVLGRLCDELGLSMLPAIGARLDGVAEEVLDGLGTRVSAAMDDHIVCGEQTIRQVLMSVLDERAERGHRVSSTTRPEGMSGRLCGKVSFDRLVHEQTPFAEGSFGYVFRGEYFGKNIVLKKAKLVALPRKVAIEFRYVQGSSCTAIML